MYEEEFWAVIDSFANTDMLEKVGGRWRLKTSVMNAMKSDKI